MAFTVFNKIADDISPAMRKINDVFVDILGSQLYYIRVEKGEEDDFGNSVDTYESGIIENAIINYPLQEVELFDNSEDTQADTNYINLNELLPITLITRFADSGIVGLEEGDILVDVVTDENSTKIPIKLEVERSIGQFNEKYMVFRKYELSLVRGEIDTDVETAISAYVSSLVL